MKSLQILMVSNQFLPTVGGVCAVTAALALHLPEYVTVVAPKINEELLSNDELGTYDRRFPFAIRRSESFEQELPRTLPSRLRGVLQFALNVLWTRPRATATLLQALRNGTIDVVCIQTLSTYWVARTLRRHKPSVKIVFYLHGEEIAGGLKTQFIDRLKRAALLQADGIVVVSSFTRDLALDLGIDANKIKVINNGVDTAHFTPGPKEVGIQERFGLVGKKVLLCLARLDERKGQDKLIEALPSIIKAVPNAVLLIVGGGSDERRLHELAAVSPVSDNIIFAGTASDEERVLYYRTADVYVMPNRTLESGDTEGFGLVFLEAGACGKPVIGGNAGGVPDAIENELTGVLVDGSCTADIASACVRLLSDDSLSARLGESGILHSARNTWDLQAKSFLAYCTQLVESGSNGHTAAPTELRERQTSL